MLSVTPDKFSISVVIPALNAEDYLPLVLSALESQILKPEEIVIVDSGQSRGVEMIVKSWSGQVPITFKKVDFAFPGHARNIGVGLAKSEWIAFIDCRTIPNADWLERAVEVIDREGVAFVGGLCVSGADTAFKENLRAATYGCGAINTMVGSVFLKRVFIESGGFLANVRAGEDSEWLQRIAAAKIRIGNIDSPTITYTGLVSSLPEAIKKWCVNNLAISDVEVKNRQKNVYLLVFALLTFLIVYNWNAMLAPGNDGGQFYLPNVTKIFVGSFLLAYLIYRGILKPLQVKVSAKFLFPFRWGQVAFVGLCLDMAKAPGLVLGAILLLKRRLKFR